MKITSPKLEFTVCENQNGGVPVIIVAAGSSSRMNGEDKQFLNIGGIPVIARTLLAFEKSSYISKIILVTREQSIKEMQLIAERYLISKLSDIVVGSDTRQQSVMCGIGRLDKNENKVLISDGARMFVTDRMIGDCVNALKTNEGCLCAVKVNDTVKDVKDGIVKDTISRDRIYLAQTPQGITVDIYKKAIEKLDITKLTDDASVLEAIGAKVVIVEGDYKNIKITTPDDIKLAEILAREV